MRADDAPSGGYVDELSLRAAAELLRVDLTDVVHGLVAGHLPIVWRGPVPRVDRRRLLERLNPHLATREVFRREP